MKKARKIYKIYNLLKTYETIQNNYGLKSQYGGQSPSINGKLDGNVEFWFRGLSDA